MPYYHIKCNGKISILRRKCNKCGKKWPFMALLRYPQPSDITKHAWGEKKPTTYAKWADKYPFVNVIARLLPNWPKWARILSTSIIILIVILVFIYFTIY